MTTNWIPLEARFLSTPPAPGTLIARDHHVYRCVSFEDIPEHLWTDEDRERCAAGRVRPFLLVLDRVDGGGRFELRLHAAPGLLPLMYTYPNKHYPVCATCHEPLPCREMVRRRTAKREMAAMEKWLQPGVCPHCGEVVTARQDAVTWPNIKVPVGPDVTFHVGRDSCRRAAADYDREWVQQSGKASRLEEKPDRYQWRGTANASQRQVLELAGRGELGGFPCLVSNLDASYVRWQPRLPAYRLYPWLNGLIEAGLIAEPPLPDTLPDNPNSHGPYRYRLTDTGRAALKASASK